MLHLKHPYVPACFGTFSLNAEHRSDSNSSVHSRHPALFFEHRPIFFFLILLIVSITTCRDTSSNSLAKELLAQ